MPVEIRKKFIGSMIGSAIGDAIGELAFHVSDKDHLISQLETISELRYTDDTAMAIGLAESITEKHDIVHHHLGDRFRYNFQREPWRGYASGPPTIFSLVQRLGITYPEAARRLFGGSGSLGNGSAMRVGPVGLFFYNTPTLYEKAIGSAEVTHAHPVGMDGAAVQAKAISQVITLSPQDAFPRNRFIDTLIDFARTSEIRMKMRLVKDLLAENAAPEVAASQIGRTVAVHESMPFALFSFLRCLSSFEECLFCAVLHGGDRDTLGAMACAISGAYLGAQAIPETWRVKLENRSYIESLAIGLFENVAFAP
jgi:poly(ADP-ribose) glycohydrolase ARH3